MDRRTFLRTLSGGLLALPFSAEAQPAGRTSGSAPQARGAARESIRFTIKDTSGAQSAARPMRFPVCVVLHRKAAKLSADTFRVVDTVTSQEVPAAFRTGRTVQEGGSRWGDIGDATRPIRSVLIDLMPTLEANEERIYELQTTGGAGDTPGGITIDTQASHYEVNTGAGGIKWRVPRAGAMSICRRLELVDSGLVLVDSDRSGLWCSGTADNGQAVDFFSRFDVSGDGATNNASATESTRPEKYATSILYQNSRRACIKISRIRMKSQDGTAFQGMDRAWGRYGTAAARDVTVDVYLTFFANSASWRIQVKNLSTGGDQNSTVASRSDVAMKGFALELHTTFGRPGAQITLRDETASSRMTSRPFTGAEMHVWQNTAPTVNGSFNWELGSRNFAFDSDMPATMLEAHCGITAADGSRGLALMPWDWRNRFPMGFQIRDGGATLRWEMLTQNHPDINRFVKADAHRLLGHQWFYAEAWGHAHARPLTDAQRTTLTRQLTGRHEYMQEGEWKDTAATAKSDSEERGCQQTSLLGRCQVDHWNEAEAWWRVSPPTMDLSAHRDRPGLIGRRPRKSGSTSRADDARLHRDQLMMTWLDDGALTTRGSAIRSVRSHQLRPTKASNSRSHGEGPLGWRPVGCYPTQARGTALAPNDYEQGGYPLTHWLSTGNHGYHALGWEIALHTVTIDQYHSLFSTRSNTTNGTLMDNGGIANNQFHSANLALSRYEYQQFFEALAWWWFQTGEEIFQEGLQFFIIGQNDLHYGRPQGGNGVAYTDLRSHGFRAQTGVVTKGTQAISDVSDTAGLVLPSNTARMTVRPAYYAVGGGGTVSSSGNRLTFSQNLPTVGDFNNRHGDPGRRMTWLGCRLRAPGDGPEYTVVRWVNRTTLEVRPAPSPALAHASWELTYTLEPALYVPESKTANTIDGRYAFVGPPTRSLSAELEQSTPASRQIAWPLAAYCAMVRCFGSTITNAQGRHDLHERVRNSALHLLFQEQVFSSDGAKAQMGGSGCFQYPILDPVHGLYSSTVATFQDYPIWPLMQAHEILESIGDAAAPVILDLLVRWCRARIMGVDDLSPNMNEPDARSIPFLRGGQMLAFGRMRMLGHNYINTCVEEPARRSNFRKSAEDMTKLSTEPGSVNTTGVNNVLTAAAFGPDVLAYVAEKKWHAAGQIAKRDAYMTRATELFICSSLGLGGNSPLASAVDPDSYGPISSQMAFAGKPHSPIFAAGAGIRSKHWVLKSNNHFLHRLKNGWAPSRP